MRSTKEPIIIINLSRIFFMNLFIFVLISLVTLTSVKFSSNFFMSEIIPIELYKSAIHNENRSLISKNDLDEISISRSAFQIATNVKPGDIRTFLGRELPGFKMFDTTIHVAGEGTNFTTIPSEFHESPPPIEDLLEEREIADEIEEEEEKPVQEVAGPANIYIYHSHSYESYYPLLKDSKSPNSTNPKANIIAVGAEFKNQLANKGIKAEHNDTDVTAGLKERGWNYRNAYQYSKEVVVSAMQSNENLDYLIDIHRDALRKKDTTKTINGKSYARLMFVVGAGHSNFEKNLELAKKLNKLIEEKYPGLSRGVISKNKSTGNGIYNQDLSERALLIEVGGVDNNMDELRNCIEAFTDVFSEYYWETRDAEES
ncbi:stage II sporulation protein P [Bacillus carboniphilus]|uniref:Stage II sporulation protein P n=1 Tax=Bacillus carboniphilus TaxID=86663 RepID=A0ABY9JVN3_9BACI|nr:stage II sporulation protein P [Bacillus carboniphilus]WLR43461.1 stage II sporulation protein P [Bacillus carboniphilus]